MSEQPNPRDARTDHLGSLLAGLGLPPTAGLSVLAAKRTQLADQLVDASERVRDRAEAQLGQLDEVEALLAAGVRRPEPGVGVRPEQSPAGIAKSPTATSEPVAPASAEPAARRPGSTGIDPAPDGFEDEAPLRRRRAASAPTRGRAGLTRGLRFAGLGALAAGVIMGVYVSGLGQQPTTPTELPAGHPTIGASAAPAVVPTLDRTQAAALKAKAAADPTDTATLKALADLYAASGEWGEAATWQGKLADTTPADTDARLILGVYAFNDGDLDGAEKAWRDVVRVNPRQAEAYYDLGFVYLARTPPDEAKASEAWQKVIDIDATSALAQNVQNHLSALATASATPAANPSATPSKG